MVIRNSVSETETPPVRAPRPPPRPSMVSTGFGPKPQPMQSYAFSNLKWPLNHSTTFNYHQYPHYHNGFGYKLAESRYDSSAFRVSDIPPIYSPLVNRDQNLVGRRLAESTHESFPFRASYLQPNYSPVVNHDHYRSVYNLPESTRRADLASRLVYPPKHDPHRVSKLGGSSRKCFESENRNRNKAAKKKPVLTVPEPTPTPKGNSEKKSTNPRRVIEKPEGKSTASDAKSKILIRLRTKNKSDSDAAPDNDDGDHVADTALAPIPTPAPATEEAPDQTSAEGPATVEVEVGEPAPKTWNLRPRKPASKPPKGNGGAPAKQVTKKRPPTRTESTRSRKATETKVSEKKETKPRISIPLSKEAIEEDILFFTGSKPARRPKKRAKNVQKQLDVITKH